MINAAADYWASAGLDQDVVDYLRTVTVRVDDLSGAHLGQANGSEIVLDVDAAGHGWFVDSTPVDNVEFSDTDGEWIASDGGDADERIDMLTVLIHEFGHVAGLTHGDDGVMDDTLSVGTRLLPGVDEGSLDSLLEMSPIIEL